MTTRDPLLEGLPLAPEALPDDIQNIDADFRAKRARTSQFDALVNHYSKVYGPDIPDLDRHAKAMMMRESGGNVDANSGLANGLMQVAPGTFTDEGGDISKINDPEENVRIGVKYLAQQLRKYKDPKLAYAAYNAGPGAVDEYGGVPPFHETINHGRAVAAYYKRLPGSDPLLTGLPTSDPGQAEEPAPADEPTPEAPKEEDALLAGLPRETMAPPAAAAPVQHGAPPSPRGAPRADLPSLANYQPPSRIQGLDALGSLTRGGPQLAPATGDMQGVEPPPAENIPSPLLKQVPSLQGFTPPAKPSAQQNLQAYAEAQPASNTEFGGGFVKGAYKKLSGNIAHPAITAKEQAGATMGGLATGAAAMLAGPETAIPLFAGQSFLETAKPEAGTGEITNPAETGTQMLTQSALGAVPGLPGEGVGAKVLSGAGLGAGGAVANQVVTELVKNGHLDPNDPEAVKHTTLKVLMGLGDPEAVKQYILQGSLGVGFAAGGHGGEAAGEFRHPNEGLPSGMAGPEAEAAKELPNIPGTAPEVQGQAAPAEAPSASGSKEDLVTRLTKAGLSAADAQTLAEQQNAFNQDNTASTSSEAPTDPTKDPAGDALQSAIENGVDVPDEALKDHPHLKALKDFLSEGKAAQARATSTPEGDVDVPSEDLDKMDALSLKKEFSSNLTADKNSSLSEGTGNPVPPVENRTGLPGNAETPTGTSPTLQNETRDALNTDGRLRTGTGPKLSPIPEEVNTPRSVVHVGEWVGEKLAYQVMGRKTPSTEINRGDMDLLELRNPDGTDKTPKEMKSILGRPVKITDTAPRLSALAHSLNEENAQHAGEPRQFIGGEPSDPEYGFNADDMAAALLNRPKTKAEAKAQIKAATEKDAGSFMERYARENGNMSQEEMAVRNKDAAAAFRKSDEGPAPEANQADEQIHFNPEDPNRQNEPPIDEIFAPTAEERATTPPAEREGWGSAQQQGEDAPPKIFAAKAMRRISGLVREGRMTPDEGVRELERVANRIDRNRDTRNAQRGPRVRGADFIEEKLLGARRRGDISEEYYQMTHWLLEKNPAVADDLGISVRSDRGGRAAGFYDPGTRLISLMKSTIDPKTGVHEILHHTERMMPSDIRAGIFKEFVKQYANRFKGADFKTLSALELMGRAAEGSRSAYEEMMQKFGNGKIPYDLYQFSNPSEFWAVNGSRILAARSQEGWVNKARQWLKEFTEHAKHILGLASDHPVIRGLNEILQTEGNFQSRHQLAADPRFHLDAEGLKNRYMNPDKVKGEQEDMFGNKGRVASQGFMKGKGKGEDRGLEGTPLFGTQEREANDKTSEDQQRLFSLKENTPQEDKEADRVMSAAIVPGLKEFLEQDVTPKTKDVLSGFKDFLSDLQKWLTPRVGVPEKAMNEVYKMKGNKDKHEFVIEQTMNSVKKGFNKLGAIEGIDFIDRMMQGREQKNEKLKALAEAYRSMLDNMFKDAKVVNKDLLYKKNYFPIRWKKPPGMDAEAFNKQQEELLQKTGKSLQGPKSFLKQKKWTTLSEGMVHGGIPETTNPQSMFELGMSEAMRYVSAQRMWESMKKQGFAEFVKVGDAPPAGYVKLKDSIARAYYPNPEVNGLNLAGDYYVEKNTARIIHNYLSEDFWRSKSYGRGLLAAKNIVTGIELSYSPFHAMFVSADAMAGKFGLGAMQAVNEGKVLEGLKNMATAISGPVQFTKTGNRVINFASSPREFIKTEAGQAFIKQFPAAAHIVDDMFSAGAKIAQHQDFKTNSIESFLQNLHSKNAIGAALRFPGAFNEMTMKPLFEVYIPRLKIGFFFHEYSQQLSQHANELAAGTLSREKLARDTWDRVENKFGEMNFDNLFWDRTLKSSLQILFRSVTWKLGTIRMAGHAALGQAKNFADAVGLIENHQNQNLLTQRGRFKMPKLDPNMAGILGIAATTATMSTIIQFMMTGQLPSELKDFMMPKTGGKDADGNDMRLSIPTYLRDALSIYKKGPLKYIEGGSSGLMARAWESAQNRDFYGNFVYDPEEPMYKKVLDVMAHEMPKPFTLTQYQKQKEGTSGPAEKALAFLGFVHAPNEYIKTEFQQKLAEAFERQVGFRPKTSEQVAMKLEKKDFVKKLATGSFTAAEMGAALKDKIINTKTVAESVKNSGLSPMEYMWKHLGKDDKENLKQYMTPAEKKKLYVVDIPKMPAAPTPAPADTTTP